MTKTIWIIGILITVFPFFVVFMKTAVHESQFGSTDGFWPFFWSIVCAIFWPLSVTVILIIVVFGSLFWLFQYLYLKIFPEDEDG